MKMRMRIVLVLCAAVALAQGDETLDMNKDAVECARNASEVESLDEQARVLVTDSLDEHDHSHLNPSNGRISIQHRPVPRPAARPPFSLDTSSEEEP
jgi:hypothetical protein